VAYEPPPEVASATSGVACGYPGTRGGRTTTPESRVVARPPQLISRVACEPPLKVAPATFGVARGHLEI
jgi:hypothetical protein